MLSLYKADLHIHSVLSACAELSMGPKDIVAKALEKKLDIIAITDHNSAENAGAVIDCAKDTKLFVIPGIEIYTREEVHVIALFESVESAQQMEQFIYSHLPEGDYDESYFGQQIVCDKNQNVIDYNTKMLPFPVNCSLHDVAHQVEQLNGIFYPAHINRKANSILRVLGFIPDNLPIKALEITKPYKEAVEELRFLKNTKYSILVSSDAHDINDVGKNSTLMKLEEPSFSEIKLAIEQKQDRTIINEE